MAIPKHYRLVNEGKDSYEMHDTRDKKNFHIAKKDLNLSMHEKLAKVQKLYDGGPIYGAPDVDDKIAKEKAHAKEVTSQGGGAGGSGDVRTPEQKAKAAEYERTGMLPGSGGNTVAGTDGEYYRGGKVQRFELGGGVQSLDDTPQDTSSDAFNWLKRQITPGGSLPQSSAPPVGINPDQPTAVTPQAVDVSSIAAPPVTPGAPVAGISASSPTGPYDIQAEMKKANELAQSGIGEQFNAAKMKSDQDAKLFQAQQQDLAQMKAEHDDRLKTMNERSNQLFDNIQNGKIDPEAYWKDHSRITAGLGVILSGIGAGLQGSTKNLAMETIQNNIEKEIDAQKSNMSTKNNLYKMNLEQTNNEKEAYAMTKSDLLTMTAAKANEIAAKVGTPQAQAQKDMLLSQLGTQQAQLHQGLAIANIAHRAYTDGVPAQAVPYLPQEQQKRMVQLPNGQMADAGSDKSAEAVKEIAAPIMETKGALTRLEELSGNMARLPLGPQRAAAEAEVNNITNNLMQMSKQNRFADPAVNFQLEKFSDPTSMKEIFNGNAGTQQLRKILDGKLDSVYRTNVPAYQQQRSQQDRIPFKKN